MLAALPRALVGSIVIGGLVATGYAIAQSSQGYTGRTLRDGGAGCTGGGCHSNQAQAGSEMSVVISGPSSVSATGSQVFTVTATKATLGSGERMGVDIAASSGSLSESASNLVKVSGEIVHSADTGTLNETNSGGSASYSFTLSPGGVSAAGSTITLYATARLGFSGGWKHASSVNITIPKLSQTITFGAQTSPRTYSNGGTFQVSPQATASSGLSISYTSDTASVCTVSGTTVTMQGAGTCTIRANQNGNSNYNAASDVTRSITINPGNQSITFGSQVVTPTYSQGTFTLSPVASASSGLAIVYSSLTTGICTKAASGTTVVIVAPGTCTIRASQPGNGDWNAATAVSRSITISKSAQTITFPTQSSETFVDNATFNINPVATSTSGLAVSYASTTPTICAKALSTSTTVTMLDPGTCTIQATQAGNANYNPATAVSRNISFNNLPGQPTNLILTPGSGRMFVAFTAPANPGTIDSYTATCTQASVPVTRTATYNISPVLVTGLTNAALASCTVVANNEFGTGPASASSSATPTSALVAPVIRSFNTVTFQVGEFKSFVAMASGNPAPSITRGGVALPSGVSYPVGLSLSGTAVMSGTPAAGTVGNHAINFTASNSQGTSLTQPFTLVIAKGNPVITFNALADRAFSTTPFAVSASIATPNSTLSTSFIVFSSDTPAVCSVSGTSVTMLSTGICTVRAASSTAAGYTASYNAATAVLQSFDITPGAQSITFAAQVPSSRTYIPGGTFTVNPLASASSGLPVSYASLNTDACTVSGSTVTIVAVGTCSIEASQDGNSNYNPATDVVRGVAITKAAQTINFAAQGSQGFSPGAMFAISPPATATSGLGVSYASTSPAICTVSGTTVTMLAVGNCDIDATQEGDANYNPAPTVSRSIAINPVPPGAPVVQGALAADQRVYLQFEPAAFEGGAPVTSFKATCNPGGVNGTSAESPVMVAGLANGVQVSCSVVAQNAAGSSPASNVFNATPVLRSGAVLWTAACSGCHGANPSGGRLNAAGSTGEVIAYARINQPDMAADATVQGLSANELSEIAKYIRNQLSPIVANTAYVTPVQVDVGLPLHLYLGGISFTDAEVVTPAANGTLSVFAGSVVTYTPNAGFAGMDSFTYRGSRTAPSLLQGEARTVTVNVATPAAPAITSAGTAGGVFGQAFSYQVTATNNPASFGASGLGAGLGVNPSTGLISGTAGAAGVFNATISATNPGGTGMQGLQITISPAAQSISFGAQSGQSFVPGGTFPVSPTATATSGLTVTYSSTTPSRCTVAGTTVTMVSAGTCTIAANQAGNGNYNAALEVTRDVAIGATVPGAPTIGSAVAGDTQASIGFSAPANNGGTAITQYNASCSPSGAGSNSVSPIIVTGLTNGVTYTCSVTATNAAGTSSASGTVMVTPQNTPVAPQITSANATSFTVLSAGTFTVVATGTPAPARSVTGTLPAGVTFTPGTGVLAGTPATGTAGSYPLNVSATNASGTAMQPFTLTVAKANQVINFPNPGARNFSNVPFAAGASATSGLAISYSSGTPGVCTVSGGNVTTVATGVCSISANQAGNADYNAAVQVTQGFTVNAASQSINFGAQASPRNFSTTPFALSPVAFANSGLTISYSTTTPSICTASGTSITTLSAGTCTIAANQAGNANYAAAPQVTQSVTVNPILPGAPTIGIATGADQQATVGFTPPASNGGSTINPYTATCTASGQTTRTGTAAGSPVIVANMVNGIAYTCSVTASNAAGTGPASGTVMVTPTSADGEALWGSVCSACHGASPTGNQLNGAGSTPAVLQHVRSLQPFMQFAQSVQNLSPAELASISAYIQNNLPPNPVTTSAGVAVPVDVSGHITFTGQGFSAFTAVEVVTPPVNGMLSTFTGRTATYTPNPGFSGSDTFTYRGKRTAPDLLGDPVQVTITVTPGAPSITSPATANGTFGQAFNYQIAATGSPSSFGASGLPPGLSVDPVTGVISGTAGAGGTFNAMVSATNVGGTGNAMLTITIAPLAQAITFNAQAPAAQSFVQGGTFPVNPLATGGASGNAVTYSSTTAAVCSVSGVTVTMITAGTCTIAANQAGNSNYAAAPQVTRGVTINAVAPGAPVIGASTPGNAQAQVAFTPPASNGGSPILDYTATCTASMQTTRTGTAAASPVTVLSLVNGVTYNCTVTARNGPAGSGPASVGVNVTPSAITVPGAPGIGTATPGNATATISFTPPASNGGSAISSYTTTCNPGGMTGSGAASPVTVGGLTNGVTYACSVTATNAAGTGAASATVQVTPALPVTLVAVTSRKLHGAAGSFDISLDQSAPIGGAVTVEPRIIGPGHRIVFEFSGPVTSVGSASALDADDAPVGTATPTFTGNTVEVLLTGIPEATRLAVSVTGVNGGVGASVAVGFLTGDVNDSRGIGSPDIAAIKARTGQAAAATTFRYDINLSGTVGAADIAAAKSRLNQVLP